MVKLKGKDQKNDCVMHPMCRFLDELHFLNISQYEHYFALVPPHLPH